MRFYLQWRSLLLAICIGPIRVHALNLALRGLVKKTERIHLCKERLKFSNWRQHWYTLEK